MAKIKQQRTVTFSAPPAYHAALIAYCSSNNLQLSELLRSITHSFLSKEGFLPPSTPVSVKAGRPKLNADE